ncbi:hypothetical protein [uncultured Methylobacterium sp.]|jgi:hypothetical protein|uniref:hypothetical protein n=1 Tax=uncultured Methylobacterium sp. TaxID=157278 RepID=UPI00261934F8|nr:hypothetical protein [uncultured Methylobacterium sp.]
MLRKPHRVLAALFAPCLVALLPASADASPRQRRIEACGQARSDGERQERGCWRLRHEAGAGFAIHGGAPVTGFYADAPADRESAASRAAQRQRDWTRAKAVAGAQP